MRKNQTISRNDSAANAAAVVTLPGQTARRWRIVKVLAGYSDLTKTGVLTIADETATIVAVPRVGAFDLDFRDGLQVPHAGEDVTVTLAAGGAAVTGSLNVIAELE